MNLKQLIALIRLRFQLSRNQIRKGGQLNSVLYSILSVGITLFAFLSFISVIVMGVILLPKCKVDDILFIWNAAVLGFIAVWAFHVMNRIQQNDAISVDKLLHLPMTFRGAFLLNYLSTFANLTFLALAPTIVGLAIAMPFARGPSAAIAIPLSLSFLFMVTAITWYLRSWLSEKMQNRRTRGLLMAIIPLVFVAGFVVIVEVAESSPVNLLSDIQLGPVPAGIVAAESGDLVLGILGTLAMMAIGGAGLLFACNSSLRKFTGDTGGGGASSKKRDAKSSARWVDSKMFWSIPGVSTPVSAVAMGTMQGFRRAPEVFAALVPVLVLAVFGSPYMLGREGYVVSDWMLPMLGPGLIAVALLGFPAFLFSTFSYDRNGFRAYMLSPVERKDVLFGKNLGVGIPTVLLGWLTMIVAQCFFPVGPLWFLGSLVSLVPCLMLLSIVGNAISVFFAVGLKRGSMTPVNAKVIPVIVLYLGILVGPFVAMLPTFCCFFGGKLLEKSIGMPMGWLYLLLSLVQIAVVWYVYRKSLDTLGPSLWQRESELLGTVANIPD